MVLDKSKVTQYRTSDFGLIQGLRTDGKIQIKNSSPFTIYSNLLSLAGHDVFHAAYARNSPIDLHFGHRKKSC